MRTPIPFPFTSIKRMTLIAGASLGIVCLAFAAFDAWAAEEGIVDKSKAAITEATEAVKETGSEIADAAESAWHRMDEGRLQNRTRDELVAWVIMGVLVGAVAGTVPSPKPTAPGKAGRLALGLAGAFLGGMIVRVARIDFDWGPVLIRYEELIFSFAGAVLLVILGRLVLARKRERAGTPARE